MRTINRATAFCYSAILIARCGEGVHVCYNGSPKNGKTQLDEHEETCPKCKEWQEKGIIPDEIDFGWFRRYNLDPSANYIRVKTR